MSEEESDEEPFPHKKHEVSQWTFDPVSGYPYTVYYCYECGVFEQIRSGVAPA